MHDEFTPERGSEAWQEGQTTERPWYRQKRFFLPLGTVLLFSSCVVLVPRLEPEASTELASGLESGEQAMSFETCTDHIRTMADRLGEAPANIVDSQLMRVVRFPASDGSVLVTCDGIDDKMIVTQSANRGWAAMAQHGPATTAAVFQNPLNGYQESVPKLLWLLMMLFGIIYMAVRGLWRGVGFGLLFFVIATFIFWPLGLIATFVCWAYHILNAADTLRQNYLRRGWREVKM